MAKRRDLVQVYMRDKVSRAKLLLGKQAALLFGQLAVAHARAFLRRWVVY